MKFGGCRNAPFFVATFQNLHIPHFRRIFEGNKSENMPNLPRNKPRSQSGKRTPTGDSKFYNSLLWRKIRFGYIIENPVCEVHLTAGYLVDCTSGGVERPGRRLKIGTGEPRQVGSLSKGRVEDRKASNLFHHLGNGHVKVGAGRL